MPKMFRTTFQTSQFRHSSISCQNISNRRHLMKSRSHHGCFILSHTKPWSSDWMMHRSPTTSALHGQLTRHHRRCSGLSHKEHGAAELTTSDGGWVTHLMITWRFPQMEVSKMVVYEWIIIIILGNAT